MRPLFTIHGGEYLVGSYVEQHFKRVNVWIPSRDRGVDLLISDRRNRHTISLQVKFSKDYLITNMPSEFHNPLRACGWWTIDYGKLRASLADFWVFVLLGDKRSTRDFVIVRTRELLRRLRAIHGPGKKIQCYLWITERKECWETRGLSVEDERKVAGGNFRHLTRDLTRFLNRWTPVAQLDARREH